jgi:hypothetical protein
LRQHKRQLEPLLAEQNLHFHGRMIRQHRRRFRAPTTYREKI